MSFKKTKFVFETEHKTFDFLNFSEIYSLVFFSNKNLDNFFTRKGSLFFF